MTDIAGLCARLRAVDHETMFDYPTSTGHLITEAADTIERQASEIERLRGARRLIYDAMVATKACGPEDLHVGRVQAYSLCLSAIDAALTGEDA
jgi:hypothetical protein